MTARRWCPALVAGLALALFGCSSDGTSPDSSAGVTSATDPPNTEEGDDAMIIDWDLSEPTLPADLGSRSDDVVSALSGPGETLDVTVRFPNGCVISGDFDGATALRELPRDDSDVTYISNVALSDTAFDTEDDIATIARDRATLFLDTWEVDDSIRSEVEAYVDQWEQNVADSDDDSPLDRRGLERTSWTSEGGDDWRGVLAFEPGEDFIGVEVYVYFDPQATPGSSGDCPSTSP